jgi:DNA-binding LacI/PurR family transcriptional regulator
MPKNNLTGETRVTSHQIARIAGVSVGTVIRVLNEEPSVSQELRERVKKVAQEVGYKYIPKRKQNSLTAESTQTGTELKRFFFCIPFDRNQSNYYGYFYPILRGASNECVRQNSSLVYQILKDTPDSLTEIKAILAQAKIDGLVLVNYASTKLVQGLTALSLPLIVVDPHQPYGLNTDIITGDVYYGTWLAVEHLAQLGHRRIIFLNGAPRFDMARRLEGFRRGLAEIGFDYEPELVLTVDDAVVGSGRAAVQNLLSQKVDFSAVVCAQDRLAFEVINALQAAGCNVPGDVSVIGMDNHDACELFSPALTTIDVQAEQKGQLAIRRLTERIHHPEESPSWSTIQVQLIKRASTGLART